MVGYIKKKMRWLNGKKFFLKGGMQFISVVIDFSMGENSKPSTDRKICSNLFF